MSDFKEWLDGLKCEFVRVKQVRQKFSKSLELNNPNASVTEKCLDKLTGEEQLKSDFEEWANKAIDVISNLEEVIPPLMEVDSLSRNIDTDSEQVIKTVSGNIKNNQNVSPNTKVESSRCGWNEASLDVDSSCDD